MGPPQHVDVQEGGAALQAGETKAYNVTGYVDLLWLCLAVGPLAPCFWNYDRTLVLAPEEVRCASAGLVGVTDRA